ncbi:MAG: zf-HC2 domain-containing protein, partial [Acidobacteria bacterium]|nr:zf-HC2 domain-containing protein [Acidobacteriota bacterium]
MTEPCDVVWPPDAEHPTEELLMAHVDDELASNDASRVQAHLDSCWSCRAKVDRMHEGITAFVEFYEGPFTEAVDPPPRRWFGFVEQLQQAAGHAPEPSAVGKLADFLRRSLVPASAPAARRLSLLALRTAGGVSLLAILALLFWRYGGETRLSASEVLRRSQVAQSARLVQVPQPVVHQRLRVTRHRASAVSANAESTWEVWHDPTAGRLRERRAAMSGDHGLVDEVTGVLRANRMDPRQPLSPASYAAWRAGVANAEDTVATAWLTGGVRAFRLKTIVQPPVGEGQIAEAEFVVRAADWHPVEESIRVTLAGQRREYALVEEGFEIVRFDRVASLFAERPSPPVTPVTPVTPVPPAPLAAPVVPDRFTDAALDQLEMDTLYRLHRVGLCLPEEAQISRSHSDGIV